MIMVGEGQRQSRSKKWYEGEGGSQDEGINNGKEREAESEMCFTSDGVTEENWIIPGRRGRQSWK